MVESILPKSKILNVCETCGKEFITYKVLVSKGFGKYCSMSCRARRVKSIEEIERIRSRQVRCVCETCGKEFFVSPSVIRQGQGKHCSRECIKKRVDLVCLVCGKSFTRTPSFLGKGKNAGSFCSRECMALHQSNTKGELASNWQGGITNKTRVCVYCGKEFQTLHSDGKFCCNDHKNKWMSENLIGRASPNYKRVDVPCKQCGAIVHVTPSRLKRTKSIYCSTTCRDSWGSEHPGKEHPAFNSRFVNCIICGKQFKLTPHWEKLGRTKYCSQECYWKDLPNLIGGANHPNWIGGSKIYCEKWTIEFRRRIRLFFNNTCVECGTPQNGKLLHCHHVYYDKKACCAKNEDGTFLSNLGIKDAPYSFEIRGDPNKFVALCDSCHARSNHKKNREYWARHYEEIVNLYYGGRSYLTKEECAALISNLS